jgi:hypothetical protein
MQSETRHLHFVHASGRVQAGKNVSQFDDVFPVDASRVVVLVETL